MKLALSFLMMDEKIKKLIESFQRDELTDHLIYKKLSSLIKGEGREVLKKLSEDEWGHYNLWKRYTGKDVKPDRWKVFFYPLLARILGITFAVKLLEGQEEEAQEKYRVLIGKVEGVEKVIEEETDHEYALIRLIKEEKLEYIGSMVLGLNDALVEITGTIAGLTFALRNTKLVGLAGVITGIAATLSMAASEYLSRRHEGDPHPIKGAFYTGLAYVITVILIVLPYFLFSLYYVAFAFTLLNALFIILFFTFFVSVVKERKFSSAFWEMFFISFGVALLSFLIGLLARKFIGVEV